MTRHWGAPNKLNSKRYRCRYDLSPWPQHIGAHERLLPPDAAFVECRDRTKPRVGGGEEANKHQLFFFLAETFRSSALYFRTGQYFRTFWVWPHWQEFFRSFKKKFSLWPRKKNNSAASKLRWAAFDRWWRRIVQNSISLTLNCLWRWSSRRRPRLWGASRSPSSVRSASASCSGWRSS